MASILTVNRQDLCHALRGLDRAGGDRHPVFSYNNGLLTLETSRGKVALGAAGEWAEPVRTKRLREVQKAVTALLKLPSHVETITLRREGTALFLGSHAVACTTQCGPGYPQT